MPNSNSDELKRAEKLISENKMDKALEIVMEVEGRAWVYYNKSKYEEVLSLALKCKELYKKIGNKLFIAGNLIVVNNATLSNLDSYQVSGGAEFKILEVIN